MALILILSEGFLQSDLQSKLPSTVLVCMQLPFHSDVELLCKQAPSLSLPRALNANYITAKHPRAQFTGFSRVERHTEGVH